MTRAHGWLRVGMPLAYAGSFAATVQRLRDYEAAGLDIVFLPEAYTFDAVSQLGFIAARTTTLELASGILNIFTRTPSLLAMTAAGLDAVSAGRFTLGLGASGPQVIEGFHGVAYDAPLGRTREIAEICRSVWRRETVVHDGRHYHLPLTEAWGGSGAGRPLKLISHPVRDRIPIVLAALGPRNVALAAELFDGWQPLFYFPEQAGEVFGPALASGRARRPADLGPLDVIADTHLAITEDESAVGSALGRVRARLALYTGGMGSRGRNFYNDVLVRYGYGDAARTVQELYLSGRKAEAAASLPDDLVRRLSLVGPKEFIAERLAAFADSGVSTLNVTPVAGEHAARVRDVATLKELAGQLADEHGCLT